MERRIVIGGGEASFVYSDDLAALAVEGTITRASHVEPGTAYGLRSGWVADMGPSGGGVLIPGTDGYRYREIFPGFDLSTEVGFPTRERALEIERIWLRDRKGL
jgi:hypothetical protein